MKKNSFIKTSCDKIRKCETIAWTILKDFGTTLSMVSAELNVKLFNQHFSLLSPLSLPSRSPSLLFNPNTFLRNNRVFCLCVFFLSLKSVKEIKTISFPVYQHVPAQLKYTGYGLFWSIKNSGEVLNKPKSRGFRATSLSTYDFSTLYTPLPHNLIIEKLINLIEWTFKREGSPYIACNDRQAFFTSEDTKRYKLWSCQNVCEALIYLLDNIYIRFGTKLYRQIVGIPMGTDCAPLVADLFLFGYERDFMTSLSDVKQAEIIEAFKSTSRYLDDLLNIDNPYF